MQEVWGTEGLWDARAVVGVAVVCVRVEVCRATRQALPLPLQRVVPLCTHQDDHTLCGGGGMGGDDKG